mgnify:CR=1 FL=1
MNDLINEYFEALAEVIKYNKSLKWVLNFFDEDDDDQSYHETIASSTNIEEEANVNIQHEMLAGLIRMIPDSDTRDIMLMHLVCL